MAQDNLNDLAKRVDALERRGGGWSRFFLQYLLAPVLVVGMGFLLNKEFERQKAEVTQLRLAQEILPALFSGDPHSAFASQQLMHRALVDADLRDGIDTLVTSYYLNKVRSLVEAGDLESANTIIQAAQTVGGVLGAQLVELVNRDEERAAALTDYQTAVARERAGFQRLIDGQYDAAITAFEQAESAYPQFHQVYEIGRLLRNNRSQLNSPSGRRAILQRIVDEMSWKAPPDLLDRIKAELNGRPGP